MTYEELCKQIDVSRETYEKLTLFAIQLEIWNKKINLVGPDTIKNLWQRHILDALQLLRYINPAKSLVDMGSGAGLPGIILAIAGNLNITLIESDQKKVAFLRHISGLLELKISIINDRIEKVKELQFDIVTARALASLTKLLEYAKPLLLPEGYCLFMKGENLENELEEAKKKWHFNKNAYPSITHKSGTIIKLSEVKEHDEDESHCNFEPKGRRR